MKKIFLCLLSVIVNISNIYSQIIPESRFKFLTNIGLEFERPQNYNHVIDVCASPYFLTPSENDDITSNLKPQNNFEKNNYIKAGIGFYSLYENNILKGRERNISFYPGFVFGFGFSWVINNSAYITWENSIRSKVYKVELIGLDTVMNKTAIRAITDIEFINIDSKILLKIILFQFEKFKILGIGGVGGSLNLNNNTDYTILNRNVILKDSDLKDPETPEFFNNSGAIAEIGTEVKFESFSFTLTSL